MALNNLENVTLGAKGQFNGHGQTEDIQKVHSLGN